MACEVCGGATDDGLVCRACLLGNVVEGDEGLFELPEELGGFRIRERIGRGASGEVWRAFQPGPDREVALKVFLDHRLGGNADRSLFLREAQALGKLDHPGIVPIYATGEEGGFLFIASPWMSGGTLEDRIRDQDYLGKSPEAVEAMVQVSRAVAHAHQHGFVHRDIKPANILIDGNGVLCLADFGIAIAESEASGGVTSGTPAYMAPEQLAGESVTTATDVWALGALMHEMLTGMMPRDSKVGLPAALDPRLRAIVGRCLKDDPAKRYPGAAALLEDLEAFLGGRCVDALPEGWGMRVFRWARRHPAFAMISLAMVLLALTTAALGVKNWRITRENEKRSVADAARFQQRAYVADIYLASRALADNQLGVARRMLERHVPEDNGRDLRGFEWFAYNALAKGDEARVFHDHDGEIRTLEMDPSGRHLLSGGRDGRVVIREIQSGTEVLSLPRADAPSQAGEIPLMAILTAKSPEIQAEVFSGRVKPDEVRMRGRPSKLGEIQCAGWSPDGSKIAVGGVGAYLRIWSFPEGKMIGLLPQFPNRQVAFSADGRQLLSIVGHGQEFELRVHDAETLERQWTMEAVNPGFAVVEDGILVVKNEGLQMVVLDANDGGELRSWPAEGISILRKSRDGRQVHALSGNKRRQLVWDIGSGKLLARKDSIDGAIGDLEVHGGRCVTAGEGQVVRVETANELKELFHLRGHEDEILALAVSPDGNWLASAGKDRQTRLWLFSEGGRKPVPSHGYGAQTRALSPDGKSWIVDREGKVALWNAGGLAFGIDGDRSALGFSNDGDRFATWRRKDSTAVIEWWATKDGQAMATVELGLQARQPWVFGWGDDGRRCAVAVGDRYVKIFDPGDGGIIAELGKMDLVPLRLVLSPNGSDVLAFGWPWNVQIGNARSGWKERQRLSQGTIGPIVFSSDGSLLATGSDENRIAIHDVASGELIKRLSGHRARLDALAFTPDGRTLVSAAADRTLRLWHVPTWRDLGILDEGVLHGHIGFDRDGKRLTIVCPAAPPFAIPEWEE